MLSTLQLSEMKQEATTKAGDCLCDSTSLCNPSLKGSVCHSVALGEVQVVYQVIPPRIDQFCTGSPKQLNGICNFG